MRSDLVDDSRANQATSELTRDFRGRPIDRTDRAETSAGDRIGQGLGDGETPAEDPEGPGDRRHETSAEDLPGLGPERPSAGGTNRRNRLRRRRHGRANRVALLG